MRTCLAAFPHATLWSHGTLMVGSLGPLRIRSPAYARHIADADGRLALGRVGLDSLAGLLGKYTAGPDEMRRFVGERPLLTVDRRRLEYHRSQPDAGRLVDVSPLRGDVGRHVVE